MPLLEIQIGENLTDEELRDALEDHMDDLVPFITSSIVLTDPRGSLVRDPCIEGIERIDATRLSLSYSYEWSSHYGCRDMNDGGDEIGEIECTYRDGVLTFESDFHDEPFPSDEL